MDIVAYIIISTYDIDKPSGTANPGVTQKPDNPPKRIRNPITRKLDNPLKGIRNLVPNRIRSQWPRGLTVPT